MSWALFAYTLLPASASLVVLLLSGRLVAMAIASKVLSAPVRCGGVEFSIGSVMTALCACLAALSYSGMRRCQKRVEAQEALVAARLRDQELRDVFYQERNLYLSLLGLCLWVVAWRLKSLHAGQQLVISPDARKRGARSVLARAAYFALGLIALLMADIPLCRMNYNLMLASTVSSKKAAIMHEAVPCEGIFEQMASGSCIQFCEKVRGLSNDRLDCINWARRWHIFGRFAAQIFDSFRGMEQGQKRINELFAEKPCTDVLRSVDKSNRVVNSCCYVFSVVALVGALAAFGEVMSQRDEGNLHED